MKNRKKLLKILKRMQRGSDAPFYGWDDFESDIEEAIAWVEVQVFWCESCKKKLTCKRPDEKD